jgi:hypothetical protein
MARIDIIRRPETSRAGANCGAEASIMTMLAVVDVVTELIVDKFIAELSWFDGYPALVR